MNEGIDTCCKIGMSLKSCSDYLLDQSFHVAPSGICRSSVKLCCLLNQKKQFCDKDFIVTSYDRFCKRPSAMYETCCTACQIGEEISTRGNFCSKVGFAKFGGLAGGFIVDLISDCCERKKRSESVPKAANLVSCSSGRFFNFSTNQCEDINECAIANNGCSNTQDCVNSYGSYACIPRSICANGFDFDYESLSCRKAADCGTIIYETINEIEPHLDTMTMESTQINVTLKPSFIRKTISCPSGLKFNQTTQSCDDINECEVENICGDSKSKCVNTVGSFSCHCLPGYQSTSDPRRKCEDVDECRLNRSICDHFCENVEGGFKCHCKRGYRVDPRNNSTCIDINECLRHKKLCSHECRNVKGSFRCNCPKGFRLGSNRRTCEDINECIEGRGACATGICNNLIGSHVCYQPTCPTGFRVYHFTRRNDFK